MIITMGCSNDNDENTDYLVSIDTNVESLSSALFGTSWQHSMTVRQGVNPIYSNGITLSFSNKTHNNPASANGHQTYTVGINGHYDERQASWWYIDNEGFYCHYSQLLYALGYTASEVGTIIAGMPLFITGSQIYKHTSSELVIKCPKPSNESDFSLVYFKKVESQENGDDTLNGSSDKTEKPDIGFYDFTATKTSLKVQYKIYNKDEAGVTSAKIYYGTSSNPTSSKTATVNGVLITANISGLKSGTTYYVKCVATGKGGTTTTTTTKCITNY